MKVLRVLWLGSSCERMPGLMNIGRTAQSIVSSSGFWSADSLGFAAAADILPRGGWWLSRKEAVPLDAPLAVRSGQYV